MRNISLTSVLVILLGYTACTQSTNEKIKSKDRTVGGQCEGCEAALEYGDRKLNATDTMPDFKEAGPRLIVTGVIYKQDGKTPAPNVILYIYHTDQQGLYSGKGNETGWGKRHGYIRGWIKTGVDGQYAFYTLRPAPYPGAKIPAHIHPLIKEPGLIPYYIDEFLFDDDVLLTEHERERQEQRGGDGIIKVQTGANEMQIMQRDIILGLNIPDYNKK